MLSFSSYLISSSSSPPSLSAPSRQEVELEGRGVSAEAYFSSDEERPTKSTMSSPVCSSTLSEWDFMVEKTQESTGKLNTRREESYISNDEEGLCPKKWEVECKEEDGHLRFKCLQEQDKVKWERKMIYDRNKCDINPSHSLKREIIPLWENHPINAHEWICVAHTLNARLTLTTSLI